MKKDLFVMKEQIKEAGGNSEKYKSGLKVNELAELVGLTEEEINLGK